MHCVHCVLCALCIVLLCCMLCIEKAIAISIDGALLVTASTHGTVVKLTDTKTKATLRTFARGMFAANIKCLGISKDKSWVSRVHTAFNLILS